MDATLTLDLIGLTFVAGLATILAPCILPIVPIFISNASTGHKLKPIATAAGLITMFVILGVFITGLGQSIGLDQENLELIAGSLLIFIGYTYINAEFGYRFWGSISNCFQKITRKVGIKQKESTQGGDSLYAAFIAGMSLGIAWIPCTGPTLGLVLTSIIGSNQNIFGGGFLLFVYAVGSILPILLISYIFRGWLDKVKLLVKHEEKIKEVTGYIVVLVGIMILFGWMREIEILIVQNLPDWKIFSGL